MIWFLILNSLLLCRLSTCVLICSVHGRLFNEWRIETCLWRFLHSWSVRRGIFFPNMGGGMTFGLDRLHVYIHRRFYMYHRYIVLRLSFVLCMRTNVGCVPLGRGRALCLNSLSNKMLFIKKNKHFTESFASLMAGK